MSRIAPSGWRGPGISAAPSGSAPRAPDQEPDEEQGHRQRGGDQQSRTGPVERKGDRVEISPEDVGAAPPEAHPTCRAP